MAIAADFWSGSGLFLCVQPVACSISTLCGKEGRALVPGSSQLSQGAACPPSSLEKEAGLCLQLGRSIRQGLFLPSASAHICERTVITSSKPFLYQKYISFKNELKVTLQMIISSVIPSCKI